MSADPTLIFAGLAGASSDKPSLLWICDADTAVLPTSETAALDDGFVTMGFVTPDGTTEDIATNTTPIPAFGATAAVRVLTTSQDVTLAVTALETNAVTLAVRNQLRIDGITVTTGGKFSITRGVPDKRYAIVVEAHDGTNHLRDVYPSVGLVTPGQRQISQAAPLQYAFNFACYADEAGNPWYGYGALPTLPVTS